MTPRVLYRILPLSERHVRWCFQDLRTTLAGMLKMRVDILNMHSHVLAHFVRPRRPKLATLAAQHDRALADGKLRMGHTVTRTRSPEALRETEGAAEPVNRFFYVFVDKYRYHCCSRCRPVDYHIFPLTSDLIGRGDYIRGSNTKLGHYRAAVYLKTPHYALLLFALVVSLRWLGACWGPNVMGGAAILTSASQLVKQPRRGQGSRAVARNTALLELNASQGNIP